MAKTPEFPIVVKKGSATVKIYLTPSRGCDLYTLSYWVNGKRKRPTFASLGDARKEAAKVVATLDKGEFSDATLDREARAAYCRAIELLKPSGVALELAVAQFTEASALLGGRPIIDAARFYAKRHPAEMPRRTVSEVVEELITAKTQDGLSYLAINDLKKLRILAADFQVQISDLNGSDVDEWLRGRELAPRTRNNYRDLVRTLFNYAKAKKYLPFDHDELASIPTANEGVTEIEIFTPSEMATIFAYAEPHVVPFLALAAFAGIRHWEITRMEWQDVKFDAGTIELKRTKTKTRFRRLIPIQPNLREWLAPYAKNSGPICTYKNMSEELMYLAKQIREKEKATKGRKFAWKHNALRHSFISYRMAILKDENKVALESGNSPKVIFESYRELVTEADAKAWFSIEPKQAANVLPMLAANDA
jgi:integrase